MVSSLIRRVNNMKKIDWTGKRIGLWTFVRFAGKDTNGDGHLLWEAHCDCGTVRNIRPMGESQSCGCIARGRRQISETEMVGKQFGFLVALKPIGKKDGRPHWLFRCLKCGKDVELNKSGVVHGRRGARSRETVKMCAPCFRKSKVKHGQAGAANKTSEYVAYHNAQQRCTNKNGREYHNYGGRGIEFRFESFEEFFAAVGPKPTPQHSLDRWPDNNGHYEVGNLRWATPTDQLRNTRLSSLASRSTEELKQELAKRAESVI